MCKKSQVNRRKQTNNNNRCVQEEADIYCNYESEEERKTPNKKSATASYTKAISLPVCAATVRVQAALSAFAQRPERKCLG